MVRVKIVLDVTYLGTRFCGWQAQNLPALTAEGSEGGNEKDDLPGPCRLYNRGRCAKGDGCRSAHICSSCWRRDRSREPHAFIEGCCPRLAAEACDPSVQETLDLALRRAWPMSGGCGAPPGGLVPSGRTDRGVHAYQMLALANCHVSGSVESCGFQNVVERLPAAMNEVLPADVRCRRAFWTEDLQFYTRGVAVKTYTYYLAQGPASSASTCSSLALGAWLLPESWATLDQEAMRQSAATLLGVHDFLPLSSVPADEAGAKKSSRSTFRELVAIGVEQPEHVNLGLLGVCFWHGWMLPIEECPSCCSTSEVSGSKMTSALQLTRIRVTGKGFLKHMVRRIVGLLVEVGLGTRAWRHFAADTSERPPKAPAHGLWLEQVEIDETSEGGEKSPSGSQRASLGVSHGE